MLLKNKILIGAIISILLLVIVYAYKEYHREPVNLTEIKADISVTAIELMRAFEENETTGNELFLGKTIDVEGKVDEVINHGDTLVNVFLDAAGGTGKVSCLIDEAQNNEALKLEPGSVITLRGVCTGYLMDVELNRCAIIR